MSEEEYTFKVTLVFWKFYDLGLYFELPDVRKFLESEGSLKLYNVIIAIILLRLQERKL